MARRARLIGSTPVRQALVLLVVFAAVNLLSLGGAWLKMRNDLTREITADLEREVASFDVSATPGALATLVTARARVTNPAETVYVFLGADGRQAGNARATLENGALRLTSRDPERPVGHAGYVHETRRLSSGVLIVAESLQPIERLRDMFLSLLVFSLVPTVLISLGIASLIAMRAARRVERIEGTLEAIAGGDLAARYQRGRGRADDLSRIGTGINRMAEQQQAATEALRQVSADIAHDLRTPLQRISVLLDDLQGTVEDGSRPAELTASAAEETARAVAVFNGLLQIAQIEGGNPAEGFADVDLCETAQRIVELYEPTAEDANDTLTLSLPDTPVHVLGDAGLIGQALSNLIENALRHTPEGSRIDVSLAWNGPGARLTVADNGPGIPPEEHDKVFRRLYRLEASRSTPGSGLGLSLVKAVAKLHGARVRLADNAPGLAVSLQFQTVQPRPM